MFDVFQYRSALLILPFLLVLIPFTLAFIYFAWKYLQDHPPSLDQTREILEQQKAVQHQAITEEKTKYREAFEKFRFKAESNRLQYINTAQALGKVVIGKATLITAPEIAAQHVFDQHLPPDSITPTRLTVLLEVPTASTLPEQIDMILVTRGDTTGDDMRLELHESEDMLGLGIRINRGNQSFRRKHDELPRQIIDMHVYSDTPLADGSSHKLNLIIGMAVTSAQQVEGREVKIYRAHSVGASYPTEWDYVATADNPVSPITHAVDLFEMQPIRSPHDLLAATHK